MPKSFIQAIPLATFNSANLTANYQAINTNGLPNACNFLFIANDSANSITISYDGVTDHDYILDEMKVVLPAQANSMPNAGLMSIGMFKKGLVVYVKGTASAGTIALSGYYQE